MKKHLTLLFILVAALYSRQAVAQHSSPIQMLFAPKEHTFTLVGAGGGNLYDLFKTTGGASSVLGFDANINIKDFVKNNKRRLQTLLIDFKVNLFNNTTFNAAYDSLDIRRFIFQDNDFRITFGMRYNFLKHKDKENARWKTFANTFFDIIIVPYQIENSAYGNQGLTVVSLNAGGKFGFMTKWGIGVFGMSINPQLDMLFIMNAPNDLTFEEVTRTYTKLPAGETLCRGYVGVGCKIEIPLTDFNLFFDFRKYIKAGSGVVLEGLTDRLQFSFGGVATGSIFQNKKKNKKK